jgi:hypothetical protein
VADPKKAVFRIVIDGTMEAVFRELTKTGEPQGAVFNAVLTLDQPGLVRGRKMQMRTGSGKHAIVVGEVVEHEPPRRFAHTHRFTMLEDPVCTVVYDLRKVDGGIEVTLTVEDIPEGTATQKEMMKGGDLILAILKAIVENGRPPLGTRAKYWFFGALEFALPAKTKSENWPLK